MSRGTGRRVVQPGTGRAGVLGVMLVGLTAAFLTLAATTPSGIGRSTDDPTRVSLDQRTFSCNGGIPGSTTRSGNLVAGLAKDQAIPTGRTVRIVEGRDVARGAFAAQQAPGKKSLAWVPCPEPRARWWFVAAGGAAVSHDTVLRIDNPRTGPAVFDVDVYGPDGVVDSPGLHGLTLAPGATRVLDLARTAPAVGNLAVSVTASRGLVSVSAADRFSPGGIGAAVWEWLPPQTLPATEQTLAGLPAKPGSATLVLANPRRSDAIATVRVIGATGTFAPQGLVPITVGPQSVVTVPLTGVLDGSPMAVRISSTLRITATVRSVEGGDTAFATGVQVINGGTAFAVAPGNGRVVLSSLSTGGDVHVVTYDAAGARLDDRTVKVPRQGSLAVKLTDKVRYVSLVSARPDIVAGFDVAGVHGIATAGVVASNRSVQLPVVRPGW
jgi:hypothetical protein